MENNWYCNKCHNKNFKVTMSNCDCPICGSNDIEKIPYEEPEIINNREYYLVDKKFLDDLYEVIQEGTENNNEDVRDLCSSILKAVKYMQSGIIIK